MPWESAYFLRKQPNPAKYNRNFHLPKNNPRSYPQKQWMPFHLSLARYHCRQTRITDQTDDRAAKQANPHRI
jgi:hypothetical protein